MEKSKTIVILMSIVALTSIIISLFCLSGIHVLFQKPLDDVVQQDIIRQNQDSIDEEYFNQINLLPKEIAQSFMSNGWELDIGNTDIVDINDERTYWIGGMSDYNHKTIWVKTPTVLLHEFGHYLDYCLGFDEIHQTIYELDGENAINILGEYYVKNRREYFASYFSYWIHNQNNKKLMNELMEMTPSTYSYFKTLSSNSWGMNTSRIVVEFPISKK